MNIWQTVALGVVLFSPFYVAAAALIVLRRLGVRTE